MRKMHLRGAGDKCGSADNGKGDGRLYTQTFRQMSCFRFPTVATLVFGRSGLAITGSLKDYLLQFKRFCLQDLSVPFVIAQQGGEMFERTKS